VSARFAWSKIGDGKRKMFLCFRFRRLFVWTHFRFLAKRFSDQKSACDYVGAKLAFSKGGIKPLFVLGKKRDQSRLILVSL